MPRVLVRGGFDDLRSRHVRFLQEASRLGDVHAELWTDEAVRRLAGKPPSFPLEERRYILESIRYVTSVSPADERSDPDSALLDGTTRPDLWVMEEGEDTPARYESCASNGIRLAVLGAGARAGFPGDGPLAGQGGAPRPKVVVTGCFDWFHSGHVRFFEEVAALGDLYVIVGSDANVSLLKGEGHPLLPQEERRYMVAAVRHVTRALISTGSGWMDAEPEIRLLSPDMYAVNEDGDKPEKREFCRQNGIRYVVLKRTPRPGLARRASTDLRGF
ncbi:MAG: adenylyltransferase/cytidyltransferase family protein [Spirochaetes bacterium]|nr:adenylyltransferase/cytidyltransferase family protein [Spirochaetota bacterium]